ncbi:MAG: exonuclease [Anaerolineae bacterium]|nr:exonuclease [Anaerolineae bacterium]
MEVYVSTDVETDGPIPGPYSMLSFGSAAYAGDGSLVATFSANLDVLPDARSDPQTMAWWADNPEAWTASRENTQPPGVCMVRYADWVDALLGTPVFVGYPAAFDFMFVYWYLIQFAGRSPFKHTALDIRTLAMALLKTDYLAASKRNMPEHWFDDLPHTHRALDDAIEQGALLCRMLAELRGG